MNATRENMPRKILALGHNCRYYVLSPQLLPLPLFFTQRLNGKSNDGWRVGGRRGGFARVSAVVPIVLATVRSATPGFRVGEIGFTPAIALCMFYG